MAKYNKLIVAAVGLLVVLAGPGFLELTDNTETLAQSILALLTAAGVYGVPNKT